MGWIIAPVFALMPASIPPFYLRLNYRAWRHGIRKAAAETRRIGSTICEPLFNGIGPCSIRAVWLFTANGNQRSGFSIRRKTPANSYRGLSLRVRLLDYRFWHFDSDLMTQLCCSIPALLALATRPIHPGCRNRKLAACRLMRLSAVSHEPHASSVTSLKACLGCWSLPLAEQRV